MLRGAILAVVGTLSVLPTSVAPGVGSVEEPMQPAGGYVRKYKEPPGPSVYHIETTGYGGAVTAMDKSSITITRGPTERMICRSPAGVSPPIWETVIDPPQPPRKFAVSEVLARGDVLKSPFFSYPYRFSDVQVGDGIVVQFRVVKGVDTIEYICIKQRPGGKVPYPPGTDEEYWKGISWWGAEKQLDVAPPPRNLGTPAPSSTR